MRPLKALLAAAASALVVTSSALAGAPPVRAAAYIVENGATGEVLASQDAAQRRAIASITKMMTVLVTLEHAKLDALVTVPEEVTTIGESTIFLRAGERISVRDLIEAALIPSANDAADTLAYYVGHGSQARFVAMMNAKARKLRLRDTHFVRPDGLDAPGHVSSARDVTKLARILMRRPVVRRIVRDTSANIEGGRTIYTRNTLLYSYPGLFGVKTGHTDLAGWSEVSSTAAISAQFMPRASPSVCGPIEFIHPARLRIASRRSTPVRRLWLGAMSRCAFCWGVGNWRSRVMVRSF